MKKRIQTCVLAAFFAIAVVTPAMAATPIEEPGSQQFSSLQGVSAEQLGAAEMDAIHGALTGQELFDKLLANAQLIRNLNLRARVVAYLTANQARLVALFDRLLALHP